MKNEVLEKQLKQLQSLLTPETIKKLSEEEKYAILETIDNIQRVRATEDYSEYVARVQGPNWKTCRHQRYLFNELEKFLEADTGNAYDILGISLAPQHGKSASFTETLPSYYLGKHPYHRIIMTAYNDELANRFGRRNREKIKQYGEELFGIRLAKVPNSDSNFELDNKIGGCKSKGLRSGITGNPAELIIIDDPIKEKLDADSITSRDRVWDEWENALRTRLAPGGKVIVISTRWHEDDLIGRMIATEGLVENGGVMTYINLPCEAEEDDPLGRKPGEPLAPELGRDKTWLEGIKSKYLSGADSGGASAWYALYQGRPRVLAGNMFKEGWFEFWYPRTTPKPKPYALMLSTGLRGTKDAVALPMEFDELLQAWDCTFKDLAVSDFVVGTVWGRRGIDYYLLDMTRRQMNVVDTMDAIERLSDKWPQARLKLIEDKANGPAVIQLLRNKVSGLVPIPVSKSKAGRAQATESAFESGHIFIPHPAVHKWSLDVMDEFTAFPNGIHDDIVDSCVHAIARFEENTANQTRLMTNSVGFRDEWKPMMQQPAHRQAKGRSKVI